MVIVIAGASGFIGKYLIQSLKGSPHQIIALSRQDRSSENEENITWKKCDLFSRRNINEVLKGCDIAFYLVHSMLPSARLSQGNFADYDLVLADNFSRAAIANKLKQIIYLGGIIPQDTGLSPHLLSRLETEKTLKTSGVALTSLRAGIVIGPNGSSFQMMYRLVKNLPVMLCPSWTTTLSNPIYIDDMIRAMNFSIDNKQTLGKYFDLGGATTVSYIQMMRKLANKMKKKRLLISLPFIHPVISRLWVSKITGAPKALVYPLVSSLKTHLVPNTFKKLPINDIQWKSFSESLDLTLKDTSELSRKPRAFKRSKNRTINQVRSIQRLQTLYRFNARETADLYFEWLPNFYKPFIKVKKEGAFIYFQSIFSKSPLLLLEHAPKVSTESYQVFFIRKCLLSHGLGSGRLCFRNLLNSRYTMAEIHDFIPSLPWYIYKFTQAKMHLFTMGKFNSYLLKIEKEIDKKYKKKTV